MRTIDRHVGARLRERREELGLSLTRVARELDLPWQQLVMIEYGWKRPNSGLLIRFAELYRTTLGSFFAGCALED